MIYSMEDLKNKSAKAFKLIITTLVISVAWFVFWIVGVALSSNLSTYIALKVVSLIVAIVNLVMTILTIIAIHSIRKCAQAINEGSQPNHDVKQIESLSLVAFIFLLVGLFIGVLSLVGAVIALIVVIKGKKLQATMNNNIEDQNHNNSDNDIKSDL
ncbi:hypothetical protein [Mycoplasma sp. 4044]